MLFPEQIYIWLVNLNIIPNTGQRNEKGDITLSVNIANNFDNGYLISETIKKMSKDTDNKLINILSTVKSDSSKNTKTTNWNFIWLAFDAIDIKMDLRIKELILRGQQALIIQIIRKLYERSDNKSFHQKIDIKMKSAHVKKSSLDFKKIDLEKDPDNSQFSLQFLILLLKASLGMRIEEILGLFTNQNKYFSQIIVKGVNSNFDPIILLYSLLNKHERKLKSFNQQDLQACLLALKTGFISKNKKVALLTIELFAKLDNIYEWFISQRGQCLITLLLGLKRHLDIKQMYWNLLLKIIEGEQLQFFTQYYSNCFQSKIEQIQVTTQLIKLISKSPLSEQLNDFGVFTNWLQYTKVIPQSNIEAQIVSFEFIGELMLNLPVVINQNEDALLILQRKWYMRSLPQFVMLFNELILILEKLADNKSSMARKIYIIVSQIAKNVSADKKDYLVQIFLLLVSKFTTMPAQNLLLNLKISTLTSTEFLLFCECIQLNENIQVSITIGNLLKQMFLMEPLVNFYAPTLLTAIISKAITNNQIGVPYILKLIDEVINFCCNLQIKYKSKTKPNGTYLGKKGPQQKLEHQGYVIKEKWKEITLHFVTDIVNLIITLKDKQNIILTIKNKLLDGNSKVRLNNNKMGIKIIQDILSKKFNVSKDQQLKYLQDFSKRYQTGLEESMMKKSKVSQHFSIAAKLKGPQNITKQFHQISQRRKQEQQQKKQLEIKKNLLEQKKKINMKKELQIKNLLAGQVGQAQLRQYGFLQRIVQQTKQLQVITFDILQEGQIEAIESVIKKYHKILRHLFVTYTWTTYNDHSHETFQDSQQRKQILNTVQLGRMLKDYRLSFLINQQEINTLVRQINMKIFNKRDLNQLDYKGFQQFVIQFCALIMIKNHTVTLTSSQKIQKKTHNFKNQPIHVILNQFFIFIKDVLVAKGEKTTMFQDIDLSISKDQRIQIEQYTKKIEKRPDYILPKEYKKISEIKVEFIHKFSPKITLPESYMTAIEILEEILSKEPFSTHIIESICEKKIVYKVKPTALGKPPELMKLRAMSNYIQRKGSLPIENKFRQRKSTSKRLKWEHIDPNSMNITEVASEVIQNIVQKLQTIENKEKERKKRLASSSKLQQLEKSKNQYLQKKAKQKEQKKQAQIQREKQQEKKRRQQTQKFLEKQKVKIAQKRKRQQQQKLRKQKEQEQKQLLKKQNKKKFKPFHQGQMQKIKKIENNALQKMRKQKQHQISQRQKQQQLKKRLRQQIQLQDKKMIELRKEGEQRIRVLFQSQPIQKVYSKYQSNLKALFDFLIHNTYLSLTDKKHNNQIVFETWRQFFTLFQLSVIVLPKDVINIFKTLTKHKLISKEYFIGLNFRQFEQALLRIAIKYKTVLNLISSRIKDKIDQQPDKAIEVNEESKEKQKQLSKQRLQKEGNQFDNIDLTIKDILSEHVQTIDSIEQYMDTSNVNNKTLLGLIYFLKIPNTKQGQQKRFRQILANKHPAFAHQKQKLKQKLSQQYTLQSPVKKTKARVSSKKIEIQQQKQSP